jgi:hypothetical protein
LQDEAPDGSAISGPVAAAATTSFAQQQLPASNGFLLAPPLTMAGGLDVMGAAAAPYMMAGLSWPQNPFQLGSHMNMNMMHLQPRSPQQLRLAGQGAGAAPGEAAGQPNPLFFNPGWPYFQSS